LSTDGLGVGLADNGAERSALYNGASKQRTLIRGEKRCDRVGARRLPEHRDGLRIAAKLGDILANPLQGRLLILQTTIRRPQLVGMKITKGAETIADRDRDDVSLVGQSRSVIPSLLSAPST
jgi:hypothetical protein